MSLRLLVWGCTWLNSSWTCMQVMYVESGCQTDDSWVQRICETHLEGGAFRMMGDMKKRNEM
jgi:hypothetical protein